ncbi:MAG: serine hydrolase domain-containing protein [Sphingobacteriaceae bacterium]
MRFSYFFSLFVLLGIGFLGSCSSAPKKRTVEDDRNDSLALVLHPEKVSKQIDAFVEKLHRTRQFNGNVLVARKGKIIYERAIGWADYLHRDSLKINSVFELASVSKPFTATAIMLLVEQGKLKLDQNVKAFFPDFPYEGITIRLLLSHRSGMMNYVYFTDDIWKEKMNPMSNMDVMKLIAQHKPAPYAQPNRVFHYNNSNFMVLGAIIEKVTGKSYAKFMEERIFKPLGMKNTHVYSTTAFKKIPVDVVGHDKVWRRSVVQNFLDGPVGDKGIYSTIHDLYLFDRALRAGKVLRKASLDSAYTPHNPLQYRHFSYGYGWRLFEAPNQQVVYHTGWWHGFRHIFVRDLKNDVTIIFLSNLTNGSLLALDDLYHLMHVPVIRRNAYSHEGVYMGGASADAADD